MTVSALTTLCLTLAKAHPYDRAENGRRCEAWTGVGREPLFQLLKDPISKLGRTPISVFYSGPDRSHDCTLRTHQAWSFVDRLWLKFKLRLSVGGCLLGLLRAL